MLSLLAGVLPAIFKLGSKLILDKDKKAEYAFKVQEMSFKLIEGIVNMRTVPWVDAVVKIMAASVAMARPIGTFIMTGVGIYFHYKGIVVDGVVQLMLDGAFPAWAGARELNKSRKHKEKLTKSTYEEDDWDD